MKAFLGMGLLGSNFVKAMLKKGEQVQVWNRTADKAKALEADGAKSFGSAAEAVSKASTVHLTLKDDDTVDEVLAAALPGFSPGVVIIDHTTTSAKGAIERTAAWKARGFTYLHAPVFMGPQNALESTGYMLVSGDETVINKLLPELAKMTGKVINFGAETGKAAGMKLIGNLFLISLTAGVADMLSLAKGLGIDPKDVMALFDSWNPATMLPARLKKIVEGNFSDPSWELNMARKDAGLMIAAANDAKIKLAVIPAVAAEMDRWIEKGHGKDDWTVIGKDSV